MPICWCLPPNLHIFWLFGIEVLWMITSLGHTVRNTFHTMETGWNDTMVPLFLFIVHFSASSPSTPCTIPLLTSPHLNLSLLSPSSFPKSSLLTNWHHPQRAIGHWYEPEELGGFAFAVPECDTWCSWMLPNYYIWTVIVTMIEHLLTVCVVVDPNTSQALLKSIMRLVWIQTADL